jgi:RNA polymerase sigma-70 factor, ECF subfamily
MARDMTQTSPGHAEEDDAGTGRVDAASASGDEAAGAGALRLTGNGGSQPGSLLGGAVGIDGFNEVVAEHESALLRYARHQLGRDYEGGHHDAQDIVQEALLRLHRQWRQDGSGGIKRIRAWLMRVTHNLVIDAVRKRGRQREARLHLRAEATKADGEMNHQANSLDTMETREATGAAMRLMQELPDTQQRVLMLRLNDLTVREIAKVLNMSPGNVGYHMNQALMTLARQLKQAGAV